MQEWTEVATNLFRVEVQAGCLYRYGNSSRGHMLFVPYVQAPAFGFGQATCYPYPGSAGDVVHVRHPGGRPH